MPSLSTYYQRKEIKRAWLQLGYELTTYGWQTLTVHHLCRTHHDDGEEDVDSVKDGDGVLVRRSNGLSTERLKDVPRQHEHEEQVEAKISVEETPGNENIKF